MYNFLRIGIDYVMLVDKSTVLRIAELAKIEVDDGDIEKLTSDLSNILGWVEQLNDVNTDDVIPMFSGVADTYLRFREDEVTEGNQQKEVLSNAPDSFDGLFAVPKVLE